MLSPGKERKCSGCRSELTLYCGTVCQKADWRRHKPFCKDSSAVEGALEELSLTNRYELMLRNGLEEFRNREGIALAARTACIAAFRIGSPSPLYLTHVIHLTFYFDPREADLLDQFTLAKGSLLTHAEAADYFNHASRRNNSKPVTSASFTQAGQKRTFGSLGPAGGAGQTLHLLPLLISGTMDPSLFSVTKSLSNAVHYDTLVIGPSILEFLATQADFPPVVPPVDYDWAGRFRRAVSRQGRQGVAGGGKMGRPAPTRAQEKEKAEFLRTSKPGQLAEAMQVWEHVLSARDLNG